MVIDTSAIIAILFGEPEAATFAAAIEQDAVRLISAASVLEAAIVVESELGESMLDPVEAGSFEEASDWRACGVAWKSGAAASSSPSGCSCRKSRRGVAGRSGERHRFGDQPAGWVFANSK